MIITIGTHLCGFNIIGNVIYISLMNLSVHIYIFRSSYPLQYILQIKLNIYTICFREKILMKPSFVARLITIASKFPIDVHVVFFLLKNGWKNNGYQWNYRAVSLCHKWKFKIMLSKNNIYKQFYYFIFHSSKYLMIMFSLKGINSH